MLSAQKSMSKPIARKLHEMRIAGRGIRCKLCNTYIPKNTHYTYSTIIGYWGSYHDVCFDRVSVNLESEDTGEFKSNSSKQAFQQGVSERIDVLKKEGGKKDD